MSLSETLVSKLHEVSKVAGHMHLSSDQDIVSWFTVNDQYGRQTAIVPANEICRWSPKYGTRDRNPEYIGFSNCLEAGNLPYSFTAGSNTRILKAKHTIVSQHLNVCLDYGVERYTDVLEKALRYIDIPRRRLWYGADPPSWIHLAGVVVLADKRPDLYYYVTTSNAEAINMLFAWRCSHGLHTLPANFTLVLEEPKGGPQCVAPVPHIRFLRGGGLDDLHTWHDGNTPGTRDIGDVEFQLFCERYCV